ncbi:MAG: hypothetical protein ACREJU_19900, partial [Nitrospiraceae bacterium]
MEQLVLVVGTDKIVQNKPFQGYSTDVHDHIPKLLEPSNNFFMLRSQAEQDVRYKQIIPYIVLRYKDSLFSYIRGKKSSESRLVAMRSIGVGGHIEPGDQSLFSSDVEMYLQAAQREVHEEVMVEVPYVDHIVALINDDSTDVGKVH